MTLSKHLALTDSETLEEVLNCLTENIAIETQGACDQKTLFEILVGAASNADSIENTTKILNSSPCGSDIRYHLDKINNFEQLESQVNLALKSKIPQGIKKVRHKMASDRSFEKKTLRFTESRFIFHPDLLKASESFYLLVSEPICPILCTTS